MYKHTLASIDFLVNLLFLYHLQRIVNIDIHECILIKTFTKRSFNMSQMGMSPSTILFPMLHIDIKSKGKA